MEKAAKGAKNMLGKVFGSRKGKNTEERAIGTLYSARDTSPVAGLDFTVQPPLAPSSDGAPPLAPVRSIMRFNPEFAFTQVAVDAEPESPPADTAQVPLDYQAEELTGEEPAPPPPAAEPEAQGERAPVAEVTSEMIVQLLVNPRLIITVGTVRARRTFSRADEVKMDGNLGINVLDFKLSTSSTDENVVPRFMGVAVSYFSSIDTAKAILTNNVKTWLETISDLNAAYGQDSSLLSQLLKNMDRGVGHYTVQAGPLAYALEKMVVRDGIEYCVGRISGWFEKFFKEIDSIIDNTLEANMQYLRARETAAAIAPA
jgi:hypothetical protein